MCFTLTVGTGRWLNDFTIFVEDSVLSADSYEFRYAVFEDSNVLVEYDGYDENMYVAVVCNVDVPCIISEINYSANITMYIID